MIDVVHLYDSGGRWIAWYRRGVPYVWGVHDDWVGWFPWPSGEHAADVLDPVGDYLGTIVGDRLLRRVARTPVAVPRRVPEPQRPTGPPDVAGSGPRIPPSGFVDVAPGRLRARGHCR